MRPLLLVSLLLAASSAPKVRRQSDTWGSWGGWSPCTRTCGGGISFRERPCYLQRPDGGPGCVGPARSHRLCHTESCPEGTRDFRAEQCAEFDGQEFQGRQYKWLPYYAAPNKCELNCIPSGESFYFKHREAVVDGTPCEPGGRDVCVDGSCRVVGCDLRLDSALREDKCLHCGGDGSTCYPVRGTFDVSDLSRGYNQILVVPMGATSIRIEEGAASRNFLAVRNVRGDYYLNGHWSISAAQALPAASTLLHYERGAEGDLAPERLHARGPTSEPLVIELISQETNPGVRFEYYLPLDALRTRVGWSHGSWSDCSTECGGGHQSRLVVCTVDGEASPDQACQHQPRPADQRPCTPQPCPKIWRWKTGPWSPCSASCGGGFQSRSVYCASAEGAVEEASCSGLAGKPPSTQACGLQRCAAWSSEPWGECSVSCGSGVRRRSVTCRGDAGSPLPDAACSSEDRPPVTEPCVRDCPPLGGQAWRVGAWGLCSKSCDSGTRRRQVLCALGPPGHCGRLQLQKPVLEEACNTQPCHLPPEVPSVQAVNISPRDLPISQRLWGVPTSDQRWGHQERPSDWVTSRDRGPHLSVSGPAPSLQQLPGSNWDASDCRLSPHGCCPDGHTASLGPQWQGCPGTSCQQSRYGCCADGVSVAEGPHQAGCAKSHGGDGAGRRPGAPTAPQKPQQDEPTACRGSQFGCCYDDMTPAAGPLGEGCSGQPSYAYPVRCLLPSSLGSCADWTVRWYFVASAGRCNRFWYGSCHGNGNNFASEEECMHSCREPQQPLQPKPGASAHGTHGDGSRSGSQQERQASGWGGDARQRAPPSHGYPSRISSEPSLLQAAQGQLVQLYCPHGAPHAGWQKDGQSVASDRHRLQPDGSLVISPLRAEDTGTYSCGDTWLGRDSEKIYLRVTGGDVAVLTEAEPRRQAPQNPAQSQGTRDSNPGGAVSSQLRPSTRLHLDRSQPGVVEADLGQQIQLTCRAEGFPPPTIEWQRDGQPLSSPRHQLRPDGTLVISNVATEDGGFYACVAFSGQDRDQRWVQLRVLEGLTITGLPSAVTVPEGDTARLLCVVAGESVNIRWSRNGLPVQVDGHHVHQSPDGTLLIYNLGVRDEGSYTCSAFRGSQSASHSTEVKVAPSALVAQPRGPGRDCIDQPELANCELILRAQFCGNEYYSSFCCASCSRFQPHGQPIWQQG